MVIAVTRSTRCQQALLELRITVVFPNSSHLPGQPAPQSSECGSYRTEIIARAAITKLTRYISNYAKSHNPIYTTVSKKDGNLQRTQNPAQCNGKRYSQQEQGSVHSKFTSSLRRPDRLFLPLKEGLWLVVRGP